MYNPQTNLEIPQLSALYSPVAYSASSYALVCHILELIEQNNFYWQDIWPAPNDLSVVTTKIELYKNISRNLLEATFFYIEHLQTGNKEDKNFYGLLIKTKLLKLGKQYYTTKEELEVTGSNCYYKEEICNRSNLR